MSEQEQQKEIPQQTTIQGPKKPEKEPNLENLDQIFTRISDDFADVIPLQNIAKKLNINTGQLILGIIFTAFTLTIFGAGNLIVKLLIGFLYPAYMSVLSIKNQNNEKGKLWVAYWILYLLLFLVDRVMWFALHDLLSLYYPVKNMFLIWMYYPKTRGAIIVFDRLLQQLNLIGILEKPKQKLE